MFSPNNSVRRDSRRSVGRRQRDDSETLQPLPLRKRSRITADTFVPPSDVQVNGSTTLPPRHRHAASFRSASFHLDDVAQRDKKQGSIGRKGLRADDSWILTKTSQYTIRKLPALPAHLQTHHNDSYRATVLPSAQQALALTHEHAIIWDYTSSAPSPPSRVVKLPYASKRGQPLPFGYLVRTGPSNDLGLVVVFPVVGTIVYWENLDSLDSLGLFQQKAQGHEGSIAGLLTGESVIDVVEAEHAGFVLVFSSGRLAQTTLRDAQGRPQVRTQFLREPSSGGGSGFLNGLKSVFTGGAWRRDIVAVRTRPSRTRGQIEIACLSAIGALQLWQLTWSGQPSLTSEIGLSAALLATLESITAPELTGKDSTLRFIDFVFNSSTARDQSTGSASDVKLLVLVAESRADSADYFLLQLTFHGEVKVEKVVPLRTYSEKLPLDSAVSPRLVFFKPFQHAYVIFEAAITLVSLQEEKAPEDSETGSTSAVICPTFEDTVWLKKDSGVQLCGWSVDSSQSKGNQPSLVLFLSRFGIVRFSVNQPSSFAPVTAKMKLEQAVYYGNIRENVIDFQMKPNIKFPMDEVEEAAKSVSKDILASLSDTIPDILPSMDQQLIIRAVYLRRLILYLNRNFEPLSRLTKWKLLWHAEKMAAVELLWKLYEARTKKSNMSRRPLLDDLLEMLHEKLKTEPDPTLGEYDPVRQWLVRDVSRLDQIVPWTLNTIHELQAWDNVTSRTEVTQLMTEANDFIIASVETALQYRDDFQEVYGLGSEVLRFGVLESGYAGMPDFWTSTHNMVNAARQATAVNAQFLKEHMNPESKVGRLSAETAQKMAGDHSRLVRVFCLTCTERFRWCLAQEDEKTRATGHNLKHEFECKTRQETILSVHEIGDTLSAIQLAEDFRDLPTLVKIVSKELGDLLSQVEEQSDPAIQAELTGRANIIAVRASEYYVKYGEDYATAFFDHHVNLGRVSRLLDEAGSAQARVTKYLRADPHRARTGWINEVLGEKQYARGGVALFTAARAYETNWWCKKVEVSVSKLAMLAAKELIYNNNESQPQIALNKLSSIQAEADDELLFLYIQDRLHRHVRYAAYNAIDSSAEVDLVMQGYGRHFVDDRPALQELLKQGLTRILANEAIEPLLLIEILTLMDSVPNPALEDDVSGYEFTLALDVLEVALQPAFREEALKLIWKRCLLRDDWEAINNTSQRTDEDIKRDLAETTLFKTLKQCTVAGLWGTARAASRLQPSGAVGAGCSVDMLKERFDWDAELAAPIAHDNAQDDEILQNMITHCRLDHWYNGCWEEVERSISDDKRRRSDTRIELSAEVYGYCREDEDSSRSAVVGPFAAGQVGDDEVAATGVFVDDFDADDESETSASISRDEDEGDGDGDGDGAGGADDDDDDGADTEREDGGGGFRDLSQENGSEDLMVLD